MPTRNKPTGNKQGGVGLVEVLLALAVLLFTAMAAGRLQSIGMHSARVSGFHLALDQLSNEMIEILRVNADDAEAGLLNFDLIPDGDTDAEGGDTAGTDDQTTADDDADGDTPVTDQRLLQWNNRVGESIPTAGGSVNCAVSFCDIAIGWKEEIDGSLHWQYYRTRTQL
ncbi:MAG: hypothetical protein KTR32_39915 [Granulosicoccus sp.]|nr:hypothetical protein [Granulosicoccus sp.]